MSTSAASAKSTSSPSSSYGSGSYGSGYGSGSSNWNKDGYDSCVQQCVAKFGSPSSMDMPPSSTSSGSSGSGKGVTHTVIVAPTQGVLRYIPFALNASVGDTVMFKWGANNHTVTKSSQIELCNKTSDKLFTSGEQNKDFTFTQVVNDTNPTFYYCGTPTHCQKGMFGIINPPNAYQQPGSASNMMPSIASKNPSTQAGWSYASNATSNNTAAGNWGMNLDMSKMPDWSMPYMAENILFTRSFLAMNPESMTQDGSVDLSPLANNAVMLPTDVAAAARLNNAASGTPSSTSSGASSTPSSASSSSGGSNGAGALASPRVGVALVAVVAAFFAL
ncbi:hypothetical protein EDB92DRAFT_1787954 [Lactarius akahatsu]|uniref:Phytocyanin domain-containing protein n=1 Tax=Lactarius akahatsu TaxID=416441 RepID=A0AAD4QFF7_9AGAM|nr:hypothetical protein EDB92DRAFT_1787954 [Lactarius akahatsu]